GRPEIISMHKAYHGSTSGALSVIGDESFKRAFRPLPPGNRSITFNDFTGLDHITKKTAAVIVEPVQGEAGYVPPDSGYLEALRRKCDEMGALLIFDEVQTGFGRTGTFFAFQDTGIKPDIITLAKGMGGGMPIGAFISGKKIMDSLKQNPILGHITTFGGHPVSCTASLATMEVIEDEKLVEQISEKHQIFKQHLKHPAIKEIRGKGLMLALQLDTFENLQKVIDHCLEQGLITDWFLFCDNAMRISPPLIIDERQIKEACSIIIEAIETVYGS
ncbi:MAG: aspartate aminotransferase family protein, partial [Owenweeksia sp.]